MQKAFLKLTAALIALGFMASTQLDAATIYFDDLTDSPEGLQIANGYGGLNWSGFWELDGVSINSYYGIGASGYANGVVSSANVAYNFNGGAAIISSASPFSVASGYFTGAFNNNLGLQIQGYSGVTLLYNQTYTVNATGPTFITLNMNNVTRVVFNSSGGVNAGLNFGSGTQFVLDNLTLGPAPEPSVLAFAAAIGAPLFLLRRRRK